MKKTVLILKNNRGAVVLSTLIVISVMIVIMVGIASMQVMQIAKDSNRANQALRYLDIMEEMGQLVARARITGLTANVGGGSCSGTQMDLDPSAVTIGFCLPGASATFNSTCISRTDVYSTGQSFCLESVTAINGVNDAALGVVPAPSPIAAMPAAASTEAFTPSTTLNATYHSEELFFPDADTTNWPSSNKNEIRTPTCATDSQMWLGCIRCNTPGVSCLEFKVCPPEQGVGCANPYVQRIAVWR